jgi:hypothetical protein
MQFVFGGVFELLLIFLIAPKERVAEIQNELFNCYHRFSQIIMVFEISKIENFCIFKFYINNAILIYNVAF